MTGFSVIELMVVVAVIAILAALAAPSFEAVSLSSKLSSEASRLVASSALARGEAIKRNAVVTMCASSNGTSCSGRWEQGWIVLHGSIPTIIAKEQASPSGIKIDGSVTTIVFQPTGVGATAATLTVCKSLSGNGDKKREIAVSLTGTTSVKTVTTGTCS